MGKVIKRILLIIGIFLLLVIAAAIILPIVYKDKIVQFAKDEANKHINARLDFDNNISLSLFRSFPDFSVGVNKLLIINKAPFEGDTLVDIGEFHATLDIMSVIKGEKMQVKDITLKKPNLHFIVLENGMSNWDIAIKSKEEAAKQGTDTTSKFKLGLKHYEIDNGNIIYDDRQGKMYARLDNLNHSGSGDFTQDIFDLATKTTIDRLTFGYGGINYLNKVNTALDLTLNIDMPHSKYTFKQNELRLNGLTVNFDGNVSMPDTVNTNMDLTFKSKQTDFKSILSLIPAIYMKDYKNLQASGNMNFSGMAKGTYNDKTYPAFQLLLGVANGTFKYPDLPSSVNNVNIDAEVKSPGGALDNMIVDVRKAHVEMAGNPFDAKILVTHPMTDPNLDAALKGKINLDNIKSLVKLDPGTAIGGLLDMDVAMKGVMSQLEKKEYDKFYAKGYIAGQNVTYASADVKQQLTVTSTRLDFTPQNVKLSNTNVKFGKSDIQADGSLSNFIGYMLKNQTIVGTLNLTSTYLDVNPFMTPSGESKPATSNEPMQVYVLPKNIDFTMKAKMGTVLYDKYDISNMVATLILKDSRLSFENMGMNMLNGHFAIDGYYDTKNPVQPDVDFKMGIKQLSIPEAFKAFNTVQQFAPIAQYMNGNMDMNMAITTSLDKNMNPIWPTLFGSGKLDIAQATVSGFAPVDKVADKLNMQQFKSMTVKDIHPSFTITKGRFYLKDPITFNVSGVKGQVIGSNGIDKTIDYTMSLDVPAGNVASQANTAIGNLIKDKNFNLGVGQTVKADVKIGGTVTNPTVNVSLKDVAGSVKSAIKDQFEQKKKELQDQANQQLQQAKQKAEEEKKKAEDQARQQAEQEKQKLQQQIDEQKKQQEQNLKNQAKDKLKGIFGK
jgi:hypothetical protein